MTNKQEIALLEEIDRLNEKIEDLKDEVTRLEKDNKLFDETIEADDRIIQQLIKEKEILKSTLEAQTLEKEKIIASRLVYVDKYEQLKRAINILNPSIHIKESTMLDNVYYLYFIDGFQSVEISKEQYELLKEVLE